MFIVTNFSIFQFIVLFQMPHESTVDPEEPMHFKAWGDEIPQSDTYERRHSTNSRTSTTVPCLSHSLSIHTHPILPLHVTHDHDDGDDDPDDVVSTFQSP